MSHPHNPYETLLAQSGFARRSLPRIEAQGLVMSPSAPLTRERIEAQFNRIFHSVSQQLGSTEAGLRRFRNSVLLAIAARDLSALASLEENLSSITTLAELCIQEAYRASAHELAARFGEPRSPHGDPLDLLVVGMGKLGGGELNASSDVDLVYLLPDGGETSGGPSGRLDAIDFFSRVGKRMSALLASHTEDGFAFRVDLRLRPNGDAGPIVHSLAMFEDYLVVHGREWERYAWVKARVVNLPVFQSLEAFSQSLQALESVRRPFVFRRYLDFNALSALRDLHEQIRAEAQRRELRREARTAGSLPTVDVKLGRGGIREIEFVAQLFQLIRGGRDEALRARGTRIILQTLAQQGRISEEEHRGLQAAYAFWRRLEHRLQYEEDQQTHVLSGQQEAYTRLASAMGLGDATALEALIMVHAEQASAVFDRLFHGQESAGGDEAALRPTDRESRLSRIAAAISTQAANTRDPEWVRAQMEDLVHSLRGRSSYLALFDEYPQALSRVARVIDASRWAAGYLRRNPIVLDELLDDRTLFEAPQLGLLRQDILAQLTDAQRDGQPDVERQMDILREAHHGQLFRLMVQDLEGRWPVESLSDQISALADLILELTLQAAWASMAQRHRETPAFAVIAYGKLGGKELGYASDLDLIFVYEDADERAPERYARLAQRMSNWLSTQTAAGSLFDIDLRLRPNGNAGLLVSDLAGFVSYQRKTAWVWEHQALTRARFCAGDSSIGRAFERAREELICMPRPVAPLLEEILAMRQKMHEGHPNTSEDFDLKHDRGGMVDIEFMVQALVLRHAHAHPDLAKNLGNIALMLCAADLRLVDRGLARSVAQAYRDLRKTQHILRLAGAPTARVNAAEFQNEREAVTSLWAQVFSDAPSHVRSLSEIHSRPKG